MTQEKFLNNEKTLLRYLRKHKSSDNYVIATDLDLAKDLNVSSRTVFRWRSRLINSGLIKYSCRCIAGKKHGIFEV